jgi:hypothetical protein
MYKKWTNEEINYLIENFSDKTNLELAENLNRSVKSIIAKVGKLGLYEIKKRTFKVKNWEKDEIEYLIENFSDKTNLELSEMLNRSIKSICKKAFTLDLHKSAEHKSKMIGKRNKMVGRDLSYDNLVEIAKQYKTRGEFQKHDLSAYSSARSKGIINNVCSHMIKQNYSTPQLLLYEILKLLFVNEEILYNTRKIIKPYELDIYIPKYKLAFEYNGKGWHENNKNDIIKNNICRDNNIQLITIIENNRDYVTDIKNQLLNNLDIINNICCLNINENDILNIDEHELHNNIKYEILDINDIENVIKKYTKYHDFVINEPKIYQLLIKNKLLKYIKHLEKNTTEWTMDNIKLEISKHENLSDFISNSKGCYLFVKRHKLEHLLYSLKREKEVWNFEKIKTLVFENKYDTMYKLRKYKTGAYGYIIKNNLKKECRELMKIIKPD